MITVEQLWADKYAAIAAAATAGEDERRAEDFLDVTRTVCGLELRTLTPRDLLILDYAKNPLVVGGDIEKTHVAQFLFQMIAQPPAGWLSRRRFFHHCAALVLSDAVAEIRAWIDRTFADSPHVSTSDGGAESRPLGTHFLAPLIVRLAAGIPGLTPPAIMDTPLPQLFQFQKVLAAEAAARTGGKYRERTSIDRLLVACLDEANQLNAAAAADPSLNSQPSTLNSE